MMMWESYRRDNSEDLINPQDAMQQESGIRSQEAPDGTRKFTRPPWQWQMHYREQVDGLLPMACPLPLQSNGAS